MKLYRHLIEKEGEIFWSKEPMKHRFKYAWVLYPTCYDELIWDECSYRGGTKKEIKSKKAKARKPYWRKKRREQRRKKKGVLHGILE